MVVFALDHLMIKPCKPINHTHTHNNNNPSVVIPTIDLTNPEANSMLVKACNEFGFFKVVNHGVSNSIISKLEDETQNFFNLPKLQKECAGIPNPFGYGNFNIGLNGDVGWLEFLLISAYSDFISQICHSVFPDHPQFFRHALENYIGKMKKLAVQILEMIGGGLNLKGEDKKAISKIIKDEKSDSYFRLNHYPPKPEDSKGVSDGGKSSLIGFGEHTDPQIISILRSNKIQGFQICVNDGTWVSVPPDDNSIFILVGDSLQVMTNGRFKSVKHRVLADNKKSRLSMIFFAAPPLSEKIAPLPCIMQHEEESLYEEFTWLEYKTSAYKTRLSDNRLLHFVKRN